MMHPTKMDSRGGWVKGRYGGLPVGGVTCWQWMLAVVLAWAGTLVKTEEVEHDFFNHLTLLALA